MEAKSILKTISTAADYAFNAPSIKRLKTAQAVSAELENVKTAVSIKREELDYFNESIKTIDKLNKRIEKDKDNPAAQQIWYQARQKIQEEIGLIPETYGKNGKLNMKKQNFLDMKV